MLIKCQMYNNKTAARKDLEVLVAVVMAPALSPMSSLLGWPGSSLGCLEGADMQGLQLVPVDHRLLQGQQVICNQSAPCPVDAGCQVLWEGIRMRKFDQRSN